MVADVNLNLSSTSLENAVALEIIVIDPRDKEETGHPKMTKEIKEHVARIYAKAKARGML